MPEADQRSPRSFAEVALELGLCAERNIRDALLVKQKLAEMDVHKSIEEILIERGYISSEGIRQIEKALKGDNRLGGFELIEKIGQGAMGAVFRAKQVSLDRIVAVKILPRSLADDPAFVDRFLREARNVARLNHPNIIQGIDAGEDRGYYYFAMEYVDGPTLNQVLQEQGPLAEKEALRVAFGVTGALGHAWNNHILHRDIKPANIMLGGDNTVKLCDLGLATALTGGDASASSAGKAVGTPYYISPEQAQGRTDIDTRSDIYSLGATLYHLLTGHPPFEGFPAAVVLSKHVSEKVTPVASFRPDVSKHMVTLMAKMMAKDTAHRHQNPTELMEDIEDILDGKAPRHSVRFRQNSTLPLSIPAGRQTGYHTATVQRKIQARKSSSANAALVFVIVLILAVAAAFYFLVFPELTRQPGGTPRRPGGEPDRTPVRAPSVPDVPLRPGPSPIVTPKPPTPTISEAETNARETLKGIATALAAGKTDYDEYLQRLGKISGDKEVSADTRKEADELTTTVKQRLKATQRLEDIARAEVKRLIDSGDFYSAAGNVVAIERSHEFPHRFADEMRGHVTSKLTQKLEAEKAALDGLLNTNDLETARRQLASLRSSLGEAAASLGLDGRLSEMQKALEEAEVKYREAAAARLVLLARAFDELRNNAGDRLDYENALHDLPRDLPKDLKAVIERETKRFSDWLTALTKKVAEMPEVYLKYKGGSIKGKAAYESPGRLRITTARGLVVVISMKGMSTDDLRAWMVKTDEYGAENFGRALLFFGHDDEALVVLKPAEITKDLALIVEAMLAASRVRQLEKDAETLLQKKADILSAAECRSAAAEARSLLSQRELPENLHQPLKALASALETRMLDLNLRLVNAKILRRGNTVELLYEATSPEHFADWRGINGRDWRYLAPGLEAVGNPGRLSSGLLFAPPISVTLQADLSENGQLTLQLGSVRVTTSAGRDGSLLCGEKRAALPPLSRGRVSFMLRWYDGKAEVQLGGRRAEVHAAESADAAPLVILGAAARLWAIRVEGLPAGPADTSQEKLAAAREAIASGKEALWPINPHFAGWLVINGTWEYSDGQLKGSERDSAIAAAVMLPSSDDGQLQASFTYRVEPRGEERWGAGYLVARWASGGSAMAGITGNRSLVVSCREDRDRRDLPRDNDDEETAAGVSVSGGRISIAAKKERAHLEIQPRFQGIPTHIGFQRSGAPGLFKDLRLHLTEAR